MTSPEADFGLKVAAMKLAPARSGVFLDFDGTLAPIVVDPEKSRPIAGAIDALNNLVSQYGVVAVVSGRPLQFLIDHLPLVPAVRICGLYGLQRLRNGKITEDPDASKWRKATDDGATMAEAQLPRGVNVERKGMTFTLHYRTVPEFGPVVTDWAAQFAARTGLDAQSGRLSVEIGPFHHIDKGAAIADLADTLSAACFIGDDAGDLTAFAALDELERTQNMRTAKVAVQSSEAPAVLLQHADTTVSGPEQVVQLLQYLSK